MPSAVWDEEEYAKLPLFDNETFAQPPAVFMCHQQDGRLCAGWVAVHDMDNSFGLRMAFSMGRIDPADADAIYDYVTTTPVFGSGAEAAAHGRRDLYDPGEKAKRVVRKLVKTKNVGQRIANANLAVACARCGERYPRMFLFGREIYCRTPDECRKPLKEKSMADPYLLTVRTLRKLAVGMPYRSQAKKRELIDWLREYRPDALTSTRSRFS